MDDNEKIIFFALVGLILTYIMRPGRAWAAREAGRERAGWRRAMNLKDAAYRHAQRDAIDNHNENLRWYDHRGRHGRVVDTPSVTIEYMPNMVTPDGTMSDVSPYNRRGLRSSPRLFSPDPI